MSKQELLAFYAKIFFPLWIMIGAFGVYYFIKLGNTYRDVLRRSKTKRIKRIQFRNFFQTDDYEEDLSDQENSEDYQKLVEFQRKGLVLFFWIVGIYFLSIILMLALRLHL